MARPSQPSSHEPPIAERQVLAQLVSRAQGQQLAWAEVRKALLKAEKVYPRSAIIQTLLGNLYAAKQRPEKALQHLRKAADRATDKLGPYCNLARLCLLQDRIDDANRWLERARSISFEHPAVLRLEGSLALKQKDLGAAK